MAGFRCEKFSRNTARISFVSNLASLGAPVLEIKQMAGHTNTQMTERYIANGAIKISDAAKAYFR